MKIEDIKELAEVIKQMRKNQGLTQSDLALTSGVGVRYIVDLERGKETCQIGKAIKIINTLGLKMDVR